MNNMQLNINEVKEYIDNNKIYYINSIYIDSFSSFRKNLKYFWKLMNKEKYPTEIYTHDFKVINYLNRIMENKNITIFLLNDFEMKDRSYINLDSFNNFDLRIPFNYLMWNVNFSDYAHVYINEYYTSYGYEASSENGNSFIDKKTIYEVERIAKYISNEDLSDLEKIIVVSNYVQKSVQYIDNLNTIRGKLNYQIISAESKYDLENTVGQIENILFLNYGLCIGIANTTTLLLNNPYLNINVGSILGYIDNNNCHEWNYVVYNNKVYYLDNTEAILSGNKIPNTLKLKSFNKDYILNGNLDKYKYNEYSVIPLPISENSISPAEIEKTITALKAKLDISFDYPEEIIFPTIMI